MSLAFDAMVYARQIHYGQERKYTGNPYHDHLAEVAGIVATVADYHHDEVDFDTIVATAWLHDTIEDHEVCCEDLRLLFGTVVGLAVHGLSDLEGGNRAQRKAAARERLARLPGWVQSVKAADIISNTSSIMTHDPKFAKTYIAEIELLLDVLTGANPRLVNAARGQIKMFTSLPLL
jgi:GTP diphosphokinase / guanosine-3',5'-bis(diphosphate) 3'-diphosphatase